MPVGFQDMDGITKIIWISSGIALLLCSCEIFYDPVVDNDVPASPGTAWTKKTIEVRETVKNPYDLSDLSKTMSLSLLLDMALYNNPSTRASWNAARASAYAYHGSLSAYYPTIEYFGDLNAQTNKGTAFATSSSTIITTGTATTTTINTHSVNQLNELTLSYLLLDFGGRSATVELALQTLYASNWTHNYTMQQVMMTLLNAYTSYLGNKGLVEAYLQDLKDAQVALNAAQVMKGAGLATLTDVLLTQSNLEQIRTSWLQAQGAEKTSLGEVLITVGLPPDSPVTVENLPQELPVIEISGNISSLLELAKKNRPDLGVAIAAIKQQQAQLAISYSNSMPTLTANADWTQIRFISPQRPSGYNEVAFFELTAPIFNGFFYMNQQRQLRAQVEEAMAYLDVQLSLVYTQVVTNYYSFISAEAALPSSRAAVEYSERAFKGFVIQYKTGTASILDVLTALTTLSNARAQEILIRTQWAASLANLAFSVGVLDKDGGLWKKAPPEDLYRLPITTDMDNTKDG